MRLLFSLTYYIPYSSGLTLYVKRLGEALVRNGYELSVISYQFKKDLKEREEINKIKVIRAMPLFKISKGFFSLDWLIKSWQEVVKADAVFINLPQFEGIIPALFAKILGKKVITIYHCEIDLPGGIINHFIEWVLNISHFITLSLSNIVITYTDDFADHSKMLPHFRHKVKYVYPPILVPKINKRIQKILMDKINLKDQFVIGVAARLAAEKGIEYLFEAIPEIELRIMNQELRHSGERSDSRIDSGQARMTKRDIFKIIIAGSLEPVGEEKYKRKILNLVEKYKDHVIFIGELKEEDMGSFYSLLNLLVLPSINSTEAFGMVQVEAMMMGMPVVATDLPGVRIPIQKTGMGKIVPVRNSQVLARVIVEVLKCKEKFIKNTEVIKKEFSIGKTVGFYQNLLDKI